MMDEDKITKELEQLMADYEAAKAKVEATRPKLPKNHEGWLSLSKKGAEAIKVHHSALKDQGKALNRLRKFAKDNA
jgi:hypothetical protein